MLTQRLGLLAAIGWGVGSPMLFADPAPTPAVQLALAETAAAPKKEDKVQAEAHLSVDKLPPGRECDILIRLNVLPGWHVNSNPAKPEGYVATEVTFKGKNGTTLATVKYPKGKLIRMKDLDDPVSVYDGRVDIFGKLAVPESAAGTTETMEIAIRYQACDDEKCLLPATIKLSGKLPVANAGESVRSINEKLFKPQDE